ncbi:MAG TPA: hypothetical protein VFT87_05740 [Candidatus Saccharimonadales bacterium]|nr:hypothetical protein [Candidatus Saccharimonadales bacterium]
MAKTYHNESEFYKELTRDLSKKVVSIEEIARPDPTIDGEAIKIYTQARGHRQLLIRFYICYTIIFTILVLSLIFLQALKRIQSPDVDFEIMPQWTLNILVTGMFAQSQSGD